MRLRRELVAARHTATKMSAAAKLAIDEISAADHVAR